MNSQKFMYIENRIKLLIVKYKKARDGKDRYVYKNGFNLYKKKIKSRRKKNVKRNIKKKQRYNPNCARSNNHSEQSIL